MCIRDSFSTLQHSSSGNLKQSEDQNPCVEPTVSLISSHLSLNHKGCWGTTDDFATSFLHFSLFSTAPLDLPNSRPVHSLMLSSHLSVCLPCLLPPFTEPCKMVLARLQVRSGLKYAKLTNQTTTTKNYSYWLFSDCIRFIAFFLFFVAGNQVHLD